MPEHVHDAVIVGGGPVGCAAALALIAVGADIVVLEAHEKEQHAPDSRTLALSWNSRLILERLDAWSSSLPATAINSIHVSHRGRFGHAELASEDLSLPALGYVVRFSDLNSTLYKRVLARGVDYRRGFRVSGIEGEGGVLTVSADTAHGRRTISTRLVVVADGGATLASATAMKVREHSYSQCAVVGLVRTDRPHGNRAYERFTPDGPIALLPCIDGYSLVWTCTPERAPGLIALEQGAFLECLRDAFGDRAGEFLEVRSRSSFPLVLRVAREQRQAGVLLLGNASQTLHPIAGQGFNLGLRDTWELAELCRESSLAEIGGSVMTEQFRRRRRADRNGAVMFTDGLARLFSNDIGPLAAVRGMGLAVLDGCLPLKRALMRRMIFGGSL